MQPYSDAGPSKILKNAKVQSSGFAARNTVNYVSIVLKGKT